MNFLPSSWDRDSAQRVQRLSASEFSQNFRKKLCRDFVAKISNEHRQNLQEKGNPTVPRAQR